MKATNILYDEDAGGPFFQACFASRPDRLFFEIVQRQENYQGFAAPNAPFRIVAQKRSARPTGMPRY